MMIRKTGSLLLALAILLGSFSAALAQDTTPAPLPATGETLHGFEVIAHSVYGLTGSPAVLLEHQKTGAQVYYIASGDINRAMGITFRTPAVDDTGVPHVFEHLTLSGSKKYPSQNFFFPMMNQTYNTFVNGMTGQVYTTYPFSSLSEEQLFVMSDIYLDGVFNPLLYDEERLFGREAWRYELADKDAPITLTGTVYSEMKGASTLSRAAWLNTLDTLFPGSIAGNDSGGAPEHIPELTYQTLVDFHGTYYHPSNVIVTLYGDLDLPRFLKLMDEDYFSKYDRKDIYIERGVIPAQTEPVTASFAFPVEEGSQTEGASDMHYAFVANGATTEDALLLRLLSGILAHEASPLSRAMSEALPSVSFGVSAVTDVPAPVLVFDISGANAADAEVFQQTVDSAIAAILRDGLNKELVDALLAAEKFSTLLISEESNIAWQIATVAGTDWAQYGNAEQTNLLLSMIDEHLALADASVYTDALSRFVAENPHNALVTTYPEPGLAEKNAAELADKLAAYKASLTDAEIEALVKSTQDQIAFNTEPPPPEMLAQLQAVTVDTLPGEITRYTVNEREEGGVRILTAEAQVEGIGATDLIFSSAHLPLEDLHYMNLLCALLGSLETDAHSKDEISLLTTRYLNGFSVSPSQVELPGKVYMPVFAADWVGMDADFEQSLALVREILFRTEFTDITEIKSILSAYKNGMRTSLHSGPLSLQLARVEAVFKPEEVYASYLSGLDFYRSLIEMETLLESDPDAFCARLAAVQQTLANRSGAIVRFSGSAEGIATFNAAIPDFIDGLSADAVQPADYSALPVPALREGIVADSQVQYNVRHLSLEEMGIEQENGTFAPIATLIDDLYLTPQLRHGLGAYGAGTMLNRSGLTLYSYRDPGVAETFAVFDALPEFLQTVELDQAELDRYIINSYSGFAMPVGPLSGAVSAMRLHVADRSQDEKLDRMREMKTFTLDDLRLITPAFEAMLENGALSTSGGAAVIEENKVLFDEVLKID